MAEAEITAFLTYLAANVNVAAVGNASGIRQHATHVRSPEREGDRYKWIRSLASKRFRALERNAGSTLGCVKLPSLKREAVSFPYRKSHLTDGRISEERIRDALVSVAGGVFREGTARPGFSRSGGTGER